MIRPHPRSTLFPYTTLFRSERRQPLRRRDVLEQQVPAALRLAARHEGRHGRRERGLGGGVRHRDRKSTRLNSSHANISYAVFCLKKKKKHKKTDNIKRKESH